MATKRCLKCDKRKPVAAFTLDRWGRVDIRQCTNCEGPPAHRATRAARPKVPTPAAVDTHGYAWQDGPCSVDGCDEDAKTRGMCRSHYGKWYRHGTPITPIRQRYPCVIEGCTDPANLKPGGMCRYHIGRKCKTGSATTPLRVRGGTTPCKYSAAHRRIRDTRGRASEHDCIDCGRQAAEWSYRGGSALEMTERRSTGHGGFVVVPYSPDPMDYDPRCKSCHNRYDNPANNREMRCVA